MAESNSSGESNRKQVTNRSSLVAMTGIVAFVVVAYLAWDLLRPAVAPCDSILEQTSVQLETKLELLGSGTELKLGRTQVQALTEKAQVAAVNLKGCCIVMGMSKLDSKEFLQCKSAISDYEDRVRALEDQVDAAAAAKKAGKKEQFESIVRDIDDSLSKEAAESKRVNEGVPTGQLRLQSRLAENTETLNACFEVFRSAQDIDGNRVKIDRQCSTTARFALKPGRYYVNTWYGNASASGEFDVVSDEMTNAVLDMNAGTLRMQSVLAAGSDALNACFDVYRAAQDIDGNRVKIDRQCADTARFYLQSGKYFVNTWYGDASSSAEFEVKAGELTNPVLELNAGTLRMQTVLAPGGDVLNACFDVYHAAQDIDGNRVKVDRQCADTARFYLREGVYFVDTWYGDASTSSEFEVKAGELTNAALDLNAGTLRMQTVLAPGGDALEACFDVFHAAQDIDGNRVKVDRQCASTARFYLRTGQYYVNSWYGNATKSETFEVKPGELTNPVLDLGAGTLRLQSALDANADPVEACFDVFHAAQDIDGNRKKVDRQCAGTARFYVRAGRYFVSTWAGDARASGELNVSAGKLTNKLFVLAAR